MKSFKILFASVLTLVTMLSGCGSMGTNVKIPMESEGKQYKLDARLYLPEGKKGPFPVVIFSHGGGYSGRQMHDFYHRAIGMFVEDGYAVIHANRRGYGRSEGGHNEPLCKRDTNESGLRAAVRDTLEVLEYVKNETLFDSSKVIFAGHSRGGMISTMTAASTPYVGVRGVISLAGGWTSCFPGFNHGALRFTSTLRKVKNLWLYSQGDSYFNEISMRGYVDTFTQAGGDVEFKMYPPSAGGHEIYDFPNYWKKDVQKFLEEVMK